jgi:hypothetical protein
MRKGVNPQKDKQFLRSDYCHQVILPVYIPNHEDYFKDGLEILKICIASLLKSSHPKTFFTIVNNGSCQEVKDYLDELSHNGSIHELIHTENIGKVNAIFKGIVGHAFPLTTISDADVLFINGWQQGVYDIFNAIPKAGAVCTTPLSRRSKYLTSNLLFDYFFSKKVRFTPVKDPAAMKEFARSIDDERFIREVHLKHNLTLTENNVRAIVGAGHFVCTYKSDIFHASQFQTSDNYIGGEALTQHIDSPVIKKGYYRLSTEDNFTFHMGNCMENWMAEKLSQIDQQKEISAPHLHVSKYSPLSWLVKGIVFPKILYSHHFWKIFQRYKGLTKAEVDDY